MSFDICFRERRKVVKNSEKLPVTRQSLKDSRLKTSSQLKKTDRIFHNQIFPLGVESHRLSSDDIRKKYNELLLSQTDSAKKDDLGLGNRRKEIMQKTRPTGLVPSEEDRWYLQDKHSNTRTTIRREMKSLDRLHTLKLGMDIESEATRLCATASSSTDKLDYDDVTGSLSATYPLVSVYFPVTLGSLQEHDFSLSPKLLPTFSPPGTGLPYPQEPWRVPTMHNRREMQPHFLSVSEHLSETTSPELSKMRRHMLLSGSSLDEDSAKLLTASPYQVDLALSRLQRLKLEEQMLLEIKRQQELERIRPAANKWYELKTPQFHYEAKKHNKILRNELLSELGIDLSVEDYRQQLKNSLRESQQLREPQASST